MSGLKASTTRLGGLVMPRAKYQPAHLSLHARHLSTTSEPIRIALATTTSKALGQSPALSRAFRGLVASRSHGYPFRIATLSQSRLFSALPTSPQPPTSSSNSSHQAGEFFRSSTDGAPPKGPKTPLPRRLRRMRRLQALLAFLTAFLIITYLSYTFVPPARHLLLALVRCSRLLRAVTANIIDYKWTFAKYYDPNQYNELEIKEFRRVDRRECHKRSSKRLFEALKKNAGIYVKLGQHVASMQVLPKEWTSTMRPLQDQCFPTPITELDAMLRKDMGLSLNEVFADFDPTPIGVASLAQVHRATDRRSGRTVAVKLQHPHLEEFAKIDIATVAWSMTFVKTVFPDFEFSWLGEEMQHMLPLEMDFSHEAWNADHVRDQFEDTVRKRQTSLYIPEVLWAEKRCMAMECE